MEIKNPSVFEVGNPLPAQFGKYFIGQAYNEWLEPVEQYSRLK